MQHSCYRCFSHEYHDVQFLFKLFWKLLIELYDHFGGSHFPSTRDVSLMSHVRCSFIPHWERFRCWASCVTLDNVNLLIFFVCIVNVLTLWCFESAQCFILKINQLLYAVPVSYSGLISVHFCQKKRLLWRFGMGRGAPAEPKCTV